MVAIVFMTQYKERKGEGLRYDKIKDIYRNFNFGRFDCYSADGAADPNF
jgi:hypothetical protein